MGGFFLSELVDVIDNRGRTLTPCRRKVAQREVRLDRAKWIGPNRIRLRFDPFAYRYIRLKVLARDQYICYWCKGPGETMDHVIPWSKGGRTTTENCICACEECNGRRGNMEPAAFARLCGVDPPRLLAQHPTPATRGRIATFPTPVRRPSALPPSGSPTGLSPSVRALLDPMMMPVMSRRLLY